jgi:hypothetical protein
MLIDSGEVVSLKRRPPFTSRKIPIKWGGKEVFLMAMFLVFLKIV